MSCIPELVVVNDPHDPPPGEHVSGRPQPRLVTRMHEASADIALMPDGKIVLTYDQKDGVSGSRALVSTDEGATWEEEIYVLCWGHSGRTSSIALKDGSVLTLLAGVEKNGTRATIWRPE